MARQLPPTELTIYTSAIANATHVADIGALMSQINRKTFRQGMQYAVAKIEFYATATADVTVSRLPHHWPAVNAWTKGMALWKQQQDDRLEESGLEQTVAAHRDFKVYIDSDHFLGTYTELQAGTTSRLYLSLPQAQLISPSVDMDWDKSQVVVPNAGGDNTPPDEYSLFILGDDVVGGRGLIKAYAESRNRPMQVDPNIVDVSRGGLYGDMFNVGSDSDMITDNAQDKNVALPYLNDIDTPIEFYPGGSENADGTTVQDFLSMQAGNRTVASSVTGPFLANCGLILFDFSNIPEGEGVALKITLMPGEYKGVMARPMQDVNN